MTPFYRLIVGLGNPGVEYARTRHNLGFMAVEELGRRYGLEFKRQPKVQGKSARGRIVNRGGAEVEIHLLMPTTYMNRSGQAVHDYLAYYKIGVGELLLVCDDTALPFGELRVRSGGSAGGHNGLKNVQQMVGTQEYARLRMGIGGGERAELSDYVLQPFTKEEAERLDGFVSRAADALEELIFEGIEPVMNRINRKILSSE
jgi:peptidyl-tRNA hydrolase, PTH1 family